MTRSTQLNSKWLQLAMVFDDPAPIVQLAAPSPTAPAGGRLLAQRCPMCGAALVHVDVGEQCTRCGVVVDL
jgi:hypothetical protein